MCLIFKWQSCNLSDDHLNTLQVHWGSEIRNHLKSGLFESRISNGPVFNWPGFCYGYSYSLNHLETGPFQIRTIFSNGAHLSRFQMVWLRDFRFHFISGPLATQPLFNHSKSRLVRISDCNCTQIVF